MTTQKQTVSPKIIPDECKGCGLCVQACPKAVLYLGKELNSQGYASVQYKGHGCVGCGACFYNCPEPSAITVVEIENEESGDDDES